MIWSLEYWYVSVIVFCICLLWWKFQPTSGFVVPEKLINKNRRNLVRWASFILIISLVLAPLHIEFVLDKKVEKEKNINIQLVYDVSISMTATDFKPSRFEAGKLAMLHLVENLEWYNISLVAFASFPLLHIPFSDETKAIYSALESTTFADFPPTDDFQWTAIWDALLFAIKNLDDASNRNNKKWIIILLTDGDSQIWIHPDKSLEIAQKLQIPIYTLGIGQEDIEIWRLYDWQKVIAKINIPLLQKISSETHWKFFRVFTSNDFSEIFSDIESTIKWQDQEFEVLQTLSINTLFYGLIAICGGFLGFVRLRSVYK